MTNPNNGATLEDCHSNFFALTDLCGIKWRRLVSDGSMGSGHGHHSYGPLDDPVLSSFARCLAADVLCVWRKSPSVRSQQQQQAFTPNDPFHPAAPPAPQFMHHHPQAPGGSSVPNAPHSQMHMQPHHMPSHLMSPNVGISMGTGHLGSLHMNVPPPYPSGPQNPHHPHSHGIPPQPSPMHNQLYNVNPSLNGPKELWIFWYGEEPELSSLVSPQLLKSESEQGSWENGLSYECRTLLFKALHNLIERCLLARDFVRIDKWFIQPCDDNQRLGLKSFPMQLSFSFSFFLHGESTVCMSVDVRQHPPIRRTTKHHLAACQNHTIPVILAPHGLAGTLTGVGYRMSEPGTHKILEEWKHFYPVEAALKCPMYDTSLPAAPPHTSPHNPVTPTGNSSSSSSSISNPTTVTSSTSIPPVLEVRVGQVLMRYPSCYVLCTDLDDLPAGVEPFPTSVQSNSSYGSNVAAPRSRTSLAADSETAACPSGPSPGKPQGTAQTVDSVEGLLPERVWQESILCSAKGNFEQTSSGNNTGSCGPATPSSNNMQNSDMIGHWDFVDPSRKSVCTCSKCNRLSGARGNQGLGNMSSQSTKGGSKMKRNSYHRRNPQLLSQQDNWGSLWDLAEDTSAIGSSNCQTTVNGSVKGTDSQSLSNHSSSNRIVGMPGTPVGGPPSFKGGPASLSASGIGCEGIGASPASVAPSPLATPRSHPASVPQQEPPMPTLSPQSTNDKMPAATPDTVAPKSVSSLSNQIFSPLVGSGSYDGAKAECGEHSSLITNSSSNNNNMGGGSEIQLSQSTTINGINPLNDSTTHFVPAQAVSWTNTTSNGLRRPVLPSKEYEQLLAEEDCSQPSDVIYDYSTIQAWLNHPVKRLKTNDGKAKPTVYNWGFGMKKIPEAPPSALANGPRERVHMGKRQSDPYEFDDEHHHHAAAAAGEGKGKEETKEEKSPFFSSEIINGSKSITKNLFTNEGIQPSIRDLEQIFDNSDTSSDETFQAPTPPGSNKPAAVEESGIQSIKNKPGLSSLRPEELSKMFPTPPSHEHNPISSPCGLQPDTPSMEGLNSNEHSSLRRPQDNYPGLGSPPDEPVDIRNIESSSSIFMRQSGGGSQPHGRVHSQDWSFVYKPSSVYKMLGSSKYAPLPVLPSQQLPPLNIPVSTTYTPSWQFITTQSSSSNPPPSVVHSAAPTTTTTTTQLHHQHPPPMVGPNLAGQMHLRPGLSPISPVPNAIRGPPSELGSPPSSNMYLRHGHGSVVQPPPPPHHGAHAPQSGHHHMYGARGPEAHALVVNLSLSDSVINLFRDHNFDSCTMCVCNATVKVVGNIRGSEVGLYIPDPSPDEDPVRCNCGFSASVNRRLAHRAGLFYEDEYDVATAAYAPLVLPSDEWYERKKSSFLLLDPKYPNPAVLAADKEASNAAAVVDNVPQFLLEMLREQCLLSFNSSASRFSGEVINHRFMERMYNYLDYLDGNRAALTALEHGRTVMLEARSGFPRMPEDTMPLKANIHYIHKWPYLWGHGPQSSQDVMQVMRTLHPLLQEAVHSKAWDAQYTVSGPLTWRQFHRLAGRGTDDRCEPQPIPSILIGSEKDFVALSPLAIKYWEKLLLEPYAYPRDVAYIVVAPDADFILYKVRTFFRELSAVYETCQFGRHCPISKVLRDGILRVGRTAATNLAAEPVDEWFSLLPDIPTACTLRLYAQVCRHYLAPQLASISLDQSLLDSPNQSSSQFPRPPQERPTPSPKMPPPSSDPSSNPSSAQGPTTPKNEYESEYSTKEGPPLETVDEDERDPPALVVYLVEPFGFGADNKDLHRMANLGLLRCFASMLNFLPDNIKNNITLQVISLEDIMNLGNNSFDSRLKMDQLRHLSLTVYSQCRRLLVHQNTVKSLTGFGPAAASELFLKTKDERKKGAYKLYTPPFILAPTKQKVSEGVEWLGGIQGHTIGGMVSSGSGLSVGPGFSPQSSVLYVAYCISEDHRWLLASATDDRGELLETTIISIYIPNRSKRRKASARKHGLQKLMDFILGIMSTGVQPWRLVVGRLGRVGHGELESWSSLLSRKSLLRASNQLKESCRQCNLQFPGDSPCVLSACLVSLEPDSCLRLMPDQFTPDERFGVSAGSSSTLSTPQDISCTHILVFPTSATTQSSQTAFQDQHINGPDLGDEDLFLINVSDVNDMGDGIDGMQDLQLGDIFGSWEDNAPGVPSPVGSPRRDSTSQPGSPGGVGASGRQSPFQSGGQGRSSGRGDTSDDLGTVLQQPLALGYLVSTAPIGQLPSWFWASCPQRSVEKSSGVFLKSALHLHSHSVLHNDDLLPQQSSAKQHPLDSQFTTDVLRFVLEGYNALSWLCLDPKTHDRKSCLPVHIQKLLQLRPKRLRSFRSPGRISIIPLSQKSFGVFPKNVHTLKSKQSWRFTLILLSLNDVHISEQRHMLCFTNTKQYT
ncbi:unnamed protein product [Allacma fusca]|uniref:Mediator of RNA polymerase II transcription subunit 13 n=1 Tax=Allacma fusca TaxID=39272 RepID=A0A8J2P2Z6_9HEXA|nr:unnamed protein product [Allacma fusca]